jgi:hypothetical protein
LLLNPKSKSFLKLEKQKMLNKFDLSYPEEVLVLRKMIAAAFEMSRETPSDDTELE